MPDGQVPNRGVIAVGRFFLDRGGAGESLDDLYLMSGF
ncbi:hypothetical protein PAECIP111892_03434 [Paenibacillus auburnensis]|uniref:Uncharacterized protein n=1 Tax=Paenibacillus auburnensis TaxID=2905649 RepID=A0ABN8GIX9_9BACL|nr:hypothetical protein PAECIP111892_03434 [Paenibacillus auburnensis]